MFSPTVAMSTRIRTHWLFCVVNRGRTRIAFSSVLPLKVTRKISNPKNLDFCSGKINEIEKQIPNRFELKIKYSRTQNKLTPFVA